LPAQPLRPVMSVWRLASGVWRLPAYCLLPTAYCPTALVPSLSAHHIALLEAAHADGDHDQCYRS
jgi:hypothetical protein